MRGGRVAVVPTNGGLVEDRARLQAAVTAALDNLPRGILPSEAKREHVDFKEEAARRDRNGLLLPGEPHNLAAADQLANEVGRVSRTRRAVVR